MVVIIAVLACSALPRITNVDAARVAVEVATYEVEGARASSYSMALLKFSDLQDRYREIEPNTDLAAAMSDGRSSLPPEELVWVATVNLFEGSSTEESERLLLVVVDTRSGMPLFTAELDERLHLPGGHHFVAELDRLD